MLFRIKALLPKCLILSNKSVSKSPYHYLKIIQTLPVKNEIKSSPSLLLFYPHPTTPQLICNNQIWFFSNFYHDEQHLWIGWSLGVILHTSISPQPFIFSPSTRNQLPEPFSFTQLSVSFSFFLSFFYCYSISVSIFTFYFHFFSLVCPYYIFFSAQISNLPPLSSFKCSFLYFYFLIHFFNYKIFIIYFPLPFNPLIRPSPQQSPHCWPCPQVLFPFCSVPPPSPFPPLAVIWSPSMSLSLFC